MATKSKLLQAAAGASGGAVGADPSGLNVEDVFHVEVWDGNSTAYNTTTGPILGSGNLGSHTGFGTSGGLKVANSSDFTLGSYWSIEAWVYRTTNSNNATIAGRWYNGENYANYVLYCDSAGSLRGGVFPTNYSIQGGSVPLNTWTHFMMSYDGSNAYMFKNGSITHTHNVGSGFDINQLGTMPLTIGSNNTSGADFGSDEHLADVRIQKWENPKDVPHYDFPVPTEPLTPNRYTVFLGCQNNIRNNANNGHTFTNTGNVTASTDSPYSTDATDAGGMVWLKARNNSGYAHVVYDTERGVNKALLTSSTQTELTRTSGLTSFNANGFRVGTQGAENDTGNEMVGWCFKKATRFFDVQKYVGTGTPQQISHDLGSEPGVIIIKSTDYTENWIVYHRSAGETKYLQLNQTGGPATASSPFNNTAPTTSDFTVGTMNAVNEAGYNYVAYLFAHNDGDGGFATTEDQDIIKCDKFTEVSGSNVKVTLGFEPQYILIKTNTTGQWGLYDSTRELGWFYAESLNANTDDVATQNSNRYQLHADGFTWVNTGQSRDIYYIAIRKGDMGVPTSAEKCFAIDQRSHVSTPTFRSFFKADAAVAFYDASYDDGANAYPGLYARQNNGNEVQWSNARDYNQRFSVPMWDYMDGAYNYALSGTTFGSWNWKHAPEFADCVTYLGTGSAQDVKHSLGVAPEMMWIKNGSTNNRDWVIYHKHMNSSNPENYYGIGNATNAALTDASGARFNSTAPTSTSFRVNTHDTVNESGSKHTAWLFASKAGIAKVGVFTGNGGTLNVDCGFTQGIRALWAKRIDTTSNWISFDTDKGIVAGSDPLMEWNNTSGFVGGFDWIDPYDAGFTANAVSVWNASGSTWIYYAVAL